MAVPDLSNRLVQDGTPFLPHLPPAGNVQARKMVVPAWHYDKAILTPASPRREPRASGTCGEPCSSPLARAADSPPIVPPAAVVGTRLDHAGESAARAKGELQGSP